MENRRRKGQRHPLQIGLEYSLNDLVSAQSDYLRDISAGGLSFCSRVQVEPGARIRIRLPVLRPVFETTAVVRWVRPNPDQTWEVGVEFDQLQSMFRARMVRQVCHIQNYRREVYEREGRVLNGEQAALEWIEKHARHFPNT